MFLFFVINSCNETKELNVKHTFIPDKKIIDLKPNRIVKTYQFLKGDSTKKWIAKTEFWHDTLIVKEVYRNYMTSEFIGFGDGDYYYYYDKNRKLRRRDFVEKPSGDTVRQEYKYHHNECKVFIYDCSRRLKLGMAHGDVVTEEDLTAKRIWLYNKMRIIKYDNKNRIIETYEPLKYDYYISQNRYTYRFEGDKLIEAKSFLNDTILYYTEKYKYQGDESIMNHFSYDEEKKCPLLSYSETSRKDKNGNIIEVEKYDENKVLLRKDVKVYDNQNRLIKMESFDGNKTLKVSHLLYFEKLN